MRVPEGTDRAVIAGFATGVGLVSVATVGIYWHFWQPGLGFWGWGLGSFALGALVGGAYARLRRVRL
jgi:hypothetical protein